jgi:hypothetical protein
MLTAADWRQKLGHGFPSAADARPRRNPNRRKTCYFRGMDRARVIAVFASPEECRAAALALRERQFAELRIHIPLPCTLWVDVLDPSSGSIAHILEGAKALDVVRESI